MSWRLWMLWILSCFVCNPKNVKFFDTPPPSPPPPPPLANFQIQGVLSYRRFSWHSFGYTCLRKIINMKKMFRLTTWKSLVRNFRVRSIQNDSIYAAEFSYTRFQSRSIEIPLRNSPFTRHFQERSPVYNWELPVLPLAVHTLLPAVLQLLVAPLDHPLWCYGTLPSFFS